MLSRLSYIKTQNRWCRFLGFILTRNIIFYILFIFAFVTPWTVTRLAGWVRSWPEKLAYKWNFLHWCKWLCWDHILHQNLKRMLRSRVIDSRTRKFTKQKYIQNSSYYFRARFRCDWFKNIACYPCNIEAGTLLYPISCLWLCWLWVCDITYSHLYCQLE
jgi:hypothetical protein